MKWALSLILLLFLLLPVFSESPELSISQEELETVLMLTGNSGKLIADSKTTLITINQSMKNISNSTKSLEEIMSDYNLITDSYKIILSNSQKNSEQLDENLEDSGSISNDLKDTTDSLKPSFWESQIGTVLKLTGVIAGSFSAGYLIGTIF